MKGKDETKTECLIIPSFTSAMEKPVDTLRVGQKNRLFQKR